MPAKDKPAVNKHKKARIIAKKELQTGTQSKIALEERVSRKTVNQITPERVGPEVLALVGNYKERLIEKAKRNVDEGLDMMHTRMYSEDSKLSEITGAVKISHDILQLQTNQPTSINSSPDDQARKLNEVHALLMAQTRTNEDGSTAKCTPEQAYRLIGAMPVPGVDEGFKKRWAEGELAKVQQLSGENNA
jgi:hypothetical protein